MPSAPWTWCFKARKALFLRRGHHVPEPVRAFGAADVVLQGPQILIPSLGGTTSLSPSVLSVPWTWCFKARKSLFFRREAPRP